LGRISNRRHLIFIDLRATHDPTLALSAHR